jgi:DNA polymerase-1
MEKDVRSEFATATELTPDMIRYGALDAFYDWHVSNEQEKIMTENAWKVWKNVDAPCIFAVMDFKGFKLDADKWIKTAEFSAKRASELQEELGFNPGSWQQVLQAVHQSGLRKITSTGAEELLPYREYPIVAKILEYRKYAKRASTYGLDFIKKYYTPETDGRIHSSYNVDGAETGRLSSNDPNGQNLPAIKEFRSCFIPSDENHSLLILDQKQQEPRITAWHSQDEHLMEICRSGKNIHLEVGRAIFSDPNLKKTDVRYKHAKAINLALVYGMTSSGLRKKINEDAETEEEKITQSDADHLLQSHFSEFPKVKRWIDAQHRLGERQGYVDTAYGRRTHLNLYSYQWMNNALNNPIQGGGADTIKLAINRIHRECRERNIEYPLVSTIHDEIVADVTKETVPEYSEMIQNAMVQEAEKVYVGIPFGVDLVIGKSWWDAKEN